MCPVRGISLVASCLIAVGGAANAQLNVLVTGVGSTQFPIATANFANEAGLMPLGSNLFQETAASGTPVTGVPGDPGFGTINQFNLEASNVDPVAEITNLISAQRAYEMNSKVITAADQMGQTLSKGMG